MNKNIDVPIYQKFTLTIDEACSYFNIGRDKLYELAKEENCKYILKNGRNILIKRQAFEEFLKYAPSI